MAKFEEARVEAAVIEALGKGHAASYTAKGKLISDAMESVGLSTIGKPFSLRGLAEKIGVSYSTIRRATQGAAIDPYDLYRIAHGLEIPYLDIATQFDLIKKRRGLEDSGDGSSRTRRTGSAGPLPKSIQHAISVAKPSIEKQQSRLAVVKTILYPDGIAIEDFYYPQQFTDSLSADESFLDEAFENEQIVVITGTAGQGKSVLLRRFASITPRHDERIPVFVELRDLNFASLIERVSHTLNLLGLLQTGQKVHDMLSSGSIRLFLDAYDEVHPEKRHRVLSEIESLVMESGNLQVVISMRPEAVPDATVTAKVYKLKNLSPEDFTPILRKLSPTDAKDITALVNEDHVGVIELVTTPLLATLLVLHFRHSNSLPESTIAFYKDLFDLLVRRHNRTGGQPKRKQASDLEPAELQLFFEALCYFVHKSRRATAIPYDELAKLATSASNNLPGRIASPARALDDVINVSNLIIDDGGTCEFAHWSIVEFFAAAFLEQQLEDNKAVFYRRVLYPQQRAVWRNVLRFLEVIDRRAYTKYFLAVALDKAATDTVEDFVSNFGLVSIVQSKARRTKRKSINNANSSSNRGKRSYVIELSAPMIPSLSEQSVSSVPVPHEDLDEIAQYLGETQKKRFEAKTKHAGVARFQIRVTREIAPLIVSLMKDQLEVALSETRADHAEIRREVEKDRDSVSIFKV